MLYPVFLFELASRFLDSDTLATASYSLPVTIFGGIWIPGNSVKWSTEIEWHFSGGFWTQ